MDNKCKLMKIIDLVLRVNIAQSNLMYPLKKM